jgi:CheY-like chemotaxis protein
LIVDDDTRNIFAIRTLLEARGIQVDHAANGRVALDMLDKSPAPDVVLMDTMMPELDGLSAMRTIRQNDKFKSLPIISLTAKAMKGDREKAFEAGATEYVSKPVDPDKLLAVIYMWTNKAAESASTRFA